MKFLLLLSIVLLLSCSHSDMDVGQNYSKLFFHRSSPLYNLRGTVKEVKETTYKATGDTASFTFSRTTIPGRTRYQLNREGYISCVEDWDFMHVGDHNVTHFSYGPKNVISTEEMKSIKRDRVSTTGGNGMQSQKEYIFYKDTLKIVHSFKADSLIDLFVLKKSGRSLMYYALDTKTKSYRDSTRYTLGEDGIYRLRVSKEQHFFRSLSHEYRNKKLVAQTSTYINRTEDTVVTKMGYNSFGDIISSEVVKSSYTNLDYDDTHFQYKYDTQNNWIEKATFTNGKVLHVIRREITYWE